MVCRNHLRNLPENTGGFVEKMKISETGIAKTFYRLRIMKERGSVDRETSQFLENLLSEKPDLAARLFLKGGKTWADFKMFLPYLKEHGLVAAAVAFQEKGFLFFENFQKLTEEELDLLFSNPQPPKNESETIALARLMTSLERNISRDRKLQIKKIVLDSALRFPLNTLITKATGLKYYFYLPSDLAASLFYKHPEAANRRNEGLDRLTYFDLPDFFALSNVEDPEEVENICRYVDTSMRKRYENIAERQPVSYESHLKVSAVLETANWFYMTPEQREIYARVSSDKVPQSLYYLLSEETQNIVHEKVAKWSAGISALSLLMLTVYDANKNFQLKQEIMKTFTPELGARLLKAGLRLIVQKDEGVENLLIEDVLEKRRIPVRKFFLRTYRGYTHPISHAEYRNGFEKAMALLEQEMQKKGV